MNITIHDTAKPKFIKYKYKAGIFSSDRFQLIFSTESDRDIVLSKIKYLWGAATEESKVFGINFMGEVWKVSGEKLYYLPGKELETSSVIFFQRVEKLYYEDFEEPRLNYMLGILEEVYHIEKA